LLPGAAIVGGRGLGHAGATTHVLS
jgi:hypothetical protein